MFDSAFNKTVLAGDLPHVKWGRINYLTETYITTKWNVWRWVAEPFDSARSY